MLWMPYLTECLEAFLIEHNNKSLHNVIFAYYCLGLIQ